MVWMKCGWVEFVHQQVIGPVRWVFMILKASTRESLTPSIVSLKILNRLQAQTTFSTRIRRALQSFSLSCFDTLLTYAGSRIMCPALGHNLPLKQNLIACRSRTKADKCHPAMEIPAFRSDNPVPRIPVLILITKIASSGGTENIVTVFYPKVFGSKHSTGGQWTENYYLLVCHQQKLFLVRHR